MLKVAANGHAHATRRKCQPVVCHGADLSLCVKLANACTTETKWCLLRLQLNSLLIGVPADDGTAAFATLQSVPRTAQAAWWGAQAGLAYKGIMSRYPDHDTQELKDALSRAHQQLAEKLLQVCQSNGGVYIKAAQTFSTIQAIPKEYRK